jgi:hypothetical protein
LAEASFDPESGMSPSRWSLVSLRPLIQGAVTAARRFPLSLLASAVCAVLAVLGIEEILDEEATFRLLLTVVLGIPLFLAVDLWVERARRRMVVRAVLWAAGALGLAAFCMLWQGWSETVRVARFLQTAAALHLLVAVAPFLGRREPAGFWEYNKRLFFRVIITGVYALVLFAGLSIALLALDKLFGVPIEPTAYGRIWAVSGFVVTTWLFLAWMPADLAALDRERSYPLGLKIFAQYLLVPIVIGYLLILTAYLVKVLITWDWPSGWIGWLVSSVATVGIFSLLMLHPAADDEGDRWVRTYWRWFFPALLPAILMLWLAIYQRVAQYGITERRYFLLALSVWLAAIAVYYALSRSRNIKLIPLTLCIGAFFTIAGPVGAYRVSERSQVHRLAGLLERNGILVSGRAGTAPGTLSTEDRREISAVLRYLLTTHGPASIAGWFEDGLAGLDSGSGAARTRLGDERARAVAARIGVPYLEPWTPVGDDGPFAYNAEADSAAIPLAGYDVLLVVTPRSQAPQQADVSVHLEGDSALVVQRAGVRVLTMPLAGLVARVDAYADSAGTGRAIPSAILRWEQAGDSVRAALYATWLSGSRGDSGVRVTGINGGLLVGFGPAPAERR